MSKMDDEANQFAMELLMPYDWLVADLQKMGGIDIDDEWNLKKLAARYRVSVPVMTLRIGQILGLARGGGAPLRCEEKDHG